MRSLTGLLSYKLFSFILFILCLKSAPIWAQQIHLTFDYSNAEETLRLLSLQEMEKGELDLFNQLPGTVALMRKTGYGTEEVYSELRRALLGTKEENKLHYSFIRDKTDELSQFLSEIKLSENEIRGQITRKLLPYGSVEQGLDITVHFILGGLSAGFTLGDEKNLYIGIHHYKDDLNSIINTCIHEMFHNIQHANFDIKPTSERLQKVNLGWAYVHAISAYLFTEGSAEFVADRKEYPTDNNPHIKELIEHARVNEYRSDEVFYLLDRMISDAGKNPDEVNYDYLYNLLFDWNWNNPGYYAGYEMTKTLTGHFGSHALNQYLTRDPIYFLNDYIKITSNQNELYQFSDTTMEMIAEILEVVAN
jgi:hypothetical protein